MSLIKKILFSLFFLSTEFFLFRSDALAEYTCSPFSCTRGYEQRYDPDLKCSGMNYCVFTGCHGINGLNYNKGATNVVAAACFVTGETDCFAWPSWADSTVAVAGDKFSPLPNEDIGSCTWHTDSRCKCLGDGDGSNWDQSGSGCVGNLTCNTSNGWYSTCDAAWGSAPTGDCWYSYSRCRPCGNSGKQCYRKDTTTASITCWGGDCGSGRCCKNPGLTSSYCSSSCGSAPPPPPPPSCYNQVACTSLGGTCGAPGRPGTLYSGKCPGDSSCVCIAPIVPPSCYNQAACTNLGGTCGAPGRSGTLYTGKCPGDSSCVCIVPCSPNCSSAASYCSGQTFSNGCGGTCTGTKAIINGGWSGWSACSSCSQSRTCNNPSSSCGGATCSGSSTQSCGSTTGTAGACGTATAGSTCTAPTTSLCSRGTVTWNDQGGSDGRFNWTCNGAAGSCGGAVGANVACSSDRAEVNGGWSGWSACSSCSQSQTCNNPSPSCGGVTCSGSSTRSCGLTNGTAGACGTANGVSTCNAPVANKCANGTNATVSVSGSNFIWTCPGTAGVCGGSPGSSASCSARDLPTVLPTTGTCGHAATELFATVPTGLCAPGTASAVTTTSTKYTWTCTGTAGTCPATAGIARNCSVIRNLPPVFGSLVIKNNLSNPVAVEAGSKNQICQTAFNDSRLVTFEITSSDPNTIADITSITLTWNGNPIPKIGAIGAVTTFRATFDSSFNNNLTYPLIVTIIDSANQSDIDNTRSFKFWDCLVPISGDFRDASASPFGTVCSEINTYPLNNKANIFNGLTYTNAISGNKTMKITSPSHYLNEPGNQLIWSKTYIPNYSQISATDIKMKLNGSCPGTLVLDNSTVSPYDSPPSLIVDLASVVDQDPWWQTANGGALSNDLITNQVPVTCTANCKISLNSLVSSPQITNSGLNNVQNWSYLGELANTNTNYDYFLTQYYAKNGVGTTLTGNKTMQDIISIGSTGVYFVTGDLKIDVNKSLAANQFFMVIVKGDITVSDTVNLVEGILVAKNIGASGSSASQLKFNGSLFAFDSVNFTRGFSTSSANNATAAVLVTLDPELLFKIPGNIAKALTNWQWGN